MYEFVTGRINGAYTPGAMSQSSQITLPELLGAGMNVTNVVRPASAIWLELVQHLAMVV